ncbi:hypothetical protein BC659_1869 [Sediminibacterium goheungense]|uniref:Uncharacterized protein n=1 Tax=Sediminibacterium goheungense TaxID=1086393 RepID=A0A4R6IVC4_9BACT|nr:hypothetical protein BC659_1869 [Sediminibacterium goheungense]
MVFYLISIRIVKKNAYLFKTTLEYSNDKHPLVLVYSYYPFKGDGGGQTGGH